MSINRISSSSAFVQNVSTRKDKNQISFEGYGDLNVFQKKQFLERLFELDAPKIAKKFSEAVEVIKDVPKNDYVGEIIDFFIGVATHLKKAGNDLKNAVGDQMGLPVGDFERDYTHTNFKSYIDKAQKTPKLTPMLDKLSEGLYDVVEANDDTAIQVAISESVSKTEPARTRGEDFLKTAISIGKEKRSKTHVKKSDMFFHTEANPMKSDFDSKKKTQRSGANPNKDFEQSTEKKSSIKKSSSGKKGAEVEDVIYPQKKLAASDKSKNRLDENTLKKIQKQMQKIKEMAQEITLKEQELEKYQDVKRILESQLRTKQEAEAKFINASSYFRNKKRADNNLSSINKIIGQNQRVYHLMENKPTRAQFSSHENFLAALEKWNATILVKADDIEAAKLSRQQVSKLRKAIAEQNKFNPSLEFMAKKIIQLKKLLNPSGLNEKELAYLKTKAVLTSLERQNVAKLNMNLKRLEQEVETLKPFALKQKVVDGKPQLVKVDYSQKLSEMEAKKPIREKFIGTDKEFRSELTRWERSNNNVLIAEQKANLFETKQGLISEIKKNLEFIQHPEQKSDLTKRTEENLLNQRRQLRSVLSTKIESDNPKAPKTVRGLWGKKLKELIQKQERFRKENAQLHELQNEMQILKKEINTMDNKISSLDYKINYLEMQKKSARAKLNKKSANRNLD